MAEEKKVDETKVDETKVEPNKFDLLTSEQKEEALKLLEKKDRKIDWKKTGKRAGMVLGVVTGVAGSFLLGRASKKSKSAGETNETTTGSDSNPTNVIDF